MNRSIRHAFQLIASLGMLVLMSVVPAAAHEAAQGEVTLSADPKSCIVDVSSEMLGSAQPSQVDGYSLVTARITFAPGGSLGAHIHPGTLVATVVSGSLGFTLITDADMDIMRAPAADGSRATEKALPGQEIVLTTGDGFVETGMVHSARNTSDGETVVIVSGLVEEGQALTQCVEP